SDPKNNWILSTNVNLICLITQCLSIKKICAAHVIFYLDSLHILDICILLNLLLMDLVIGIPLSQMPLATERNLSMKLLHHR
ncbi:hypothetical protein ACJX0J_040408, partial [Zea mays]